ncbi:MAG: hypothetical protein DRP64_00070 [Verrucomicrobia bacterium]|nr:MAG: hypothetical protein DRP64_00070 [Verrucomicrobiota bacterium]
MIGEINGQAINTELPLNGLSPRVKLIVVGFTDSAFSARGVEFLSGFPVVGFTSSTFSPPYLWDERRNSQVSEFCSPVFQAVFPSSECKTEFLSAPVSEIETFNSQDIFMDFTSEPTQKLWEFSSVPRQEIIDGYLEEDIVEFDSIPNVNTRGEC